MLRKSREEIRFIVILENSKRKSKLMGIRAKIVGTGLYVPETVLTNSDLEKMLGISDEWITTRTGIKERRIVQKKDYGKVLASDLATKASRHALQDAGMDIKDIDLIICATFSQDRIIPSTACIVQKKLGAKGCAAFDIHAACTGFIYGLSLANILIQSDTNRNILLVATESHTRYIDWGDKTTCVLFGDVAGAVVLGASDDESGVLVNTLGADGSLGHLLYTPLWGDKKLRMHGDETFKHAVRRMNEAALNALGRARIKAEDIDLMIPHQANIRIIDAMASRLNLSGSRIIINIEKYGNTSAATIPIALHEALEQKRIKKGDIILMVAFGAGFTWGASVIRW
jgi:3-oxoacyl-[acyl-carrier-protein] synthase-3